MAPPANDKFFISFPDSDPPRTIKTLGRILTLPYLQKNAPPGRQVTGLQDEEGRLWDLHGNLPGGQYTAVYEEEEEDYLNETANAVDVARAYMAAHYTPLTESHWQHLIQTRHQGQHDILAIAEAKVYAPMFPQRAPWSYTLCLTNDAVVVALECQAFEAAFCEFTRTREWSSSSGQGQGYIHHWAYALAASLPFITLLSLCTSSSHLFSWDTIGAEPSPKRKLVFTGRSVGGMVAHVAALLARETSLQGANVEVRAVAFGAPPCVSSGIATALAQSGMDHQHVTFFHEADVRLRLLHVAFGVQLCKQVGKDRTFEDLIGWTKKLLSHSHDRDAWQAWMHLYQNGLQDMMELNAATIAPQRFVPLGVFCRETITRTIKTSEDPYDIERWVDAIKLQFQRVEGLPLSASLILQCSEFPLPQEWDIKVVTDHFFPDVQNCLVEVYPEKEDLPPRVVIKFTGLHLENLVQRDTMAMGLAVRGMGGTSRCPLLLHDITTVDFDSSCTVAVTHHSVTEASVELNGLLIRRTPLRLSLVNDFGESKPFTTTRVETTEQEKLVMQVFSTFNEDLLITAFMRSMMLMTCLPETKHAPEMGSHRGPPPPSTHASAVPEPLTLLFEVEELLLKRRSRLQEIAEEYSDKGDRIHYAVCQARKVIAEIVQQLMTPLKLKYTNPGLKIMKKVAGGIGIITGGVISIVGGALATPGTLLALVGAIGTGLEEEPSRWSYPGIYLALPGMGLSAAGVWLARRSHAASRDQPTLQYASILKLILNILYDCSDRVIYEVPSLEDRIAAQARKQIANFAHSRPHLDGQELWNISEEDLDYVLTQFDEGSSTCSGEYLHASFSSRQTIRLWMRISGRIHRIRSQLESHLVIGFVGVHNAGKSTWINTLFDLGVMADRIKRTEAIDPRPLHVSPSEAVRRSWHHKNRSSLQVTVVDYPGSSDQREDIALVADRLAQVTTLFVCVFRFGHIAKAEKQVVDMAKRSERDFIVLINQCDIARDLDVRESEYRSNYAEVLEVEESRLQFVSSRSPERAEYVRHLLWLHLQLLTPQPEDRVELAMKLLDAEKKAHIVENLETLNLHHALVLPFERGIESGTRMDCEECGSQTPAASTWFPKSISVLLVHNEVYEWLIEVGIPERDIEAVYRCLDAHFLHHGDPMADSTQPLSAQKRKTLVMHQNTLAWIQEELARLSAQLPSGEDFSHEQSTLAWLMFSLCSTIKHFLASLQQEAPDISRENAIAALEFTLKEHRPLTQEAVLEVAHSLSHPSSTHKSSSPLPSHSSRTTVFRRNELIYNLALSTRLWPAPRMVLKPFDVYKGDFHGQNMPLLKRLKLFTSRVVKLKRTFSLFSDVPTITMTEENVLSPDAIASYILAIQPQDLQERKYKISGISPSEFVSLAVSAFHQASLLLEYEGGLYFNPCGPFTSQLMRALGRLIGVRLQDHHEADRSAFPLQFSLTICKIILGEPLSFTDLEYLCPSLCKRIRYLCLLPPDDVDAQAITFVDEIGNEVAGEVPENHEAELLPHGSSMTVTSSNLNEYLRALVFHRLGRHLSLDSFVVGVQDVIPREYLCVFSSQMLLLLVNGVPPKFSVDELRRSSLVTKDISDDMQRWFWECVEGMKEEDAALFLIFVTGVPWLPSTGLKPNFMLKSVKGSLITSLRVNHVLQLPKFTSKEQLAHNLLLAVRKNACPT